MLQLVPVLMLSFVEPKVVDWEVWAAEPLLFCTARMYQHKVGRGSWLDLHCVTFGQKPYHFHIDGAHKA